MIGSLQVGRASPLLGGGRYTILLLLPLCDMPWNATSPLHCTPHAPHATTPHPSHTTPGAPAPAPASAPTPRTPHAYTTHHHPFPPTPPTQRAPPHPTRGLPLPPTYHYTEFAARFLPHFHICLRAFLTPCTLFAERLLPPARPYRKRGSRHLGGRAHPSPPTPPPYLPPPPNAFHHRTNCPGRANTWLVFSLPAYLATHRTGSVPRGRRGRRYLTPACHARWRFSVRLRVWYIPHPRPTPCAHSYRARICMPLRPRYQARSGIRARWHLRACLRKR